jgi:hypothetical protein
LRRLADELENIKGVEEGVGLGHGKGKVLASLVFVFFGVV